MFSSYGQHRFQKCLGTEWRKKFCNQCNIDLGPFLKFELSAQPANNFKTPNPVVVSLGSFNNIPVLLSATSGYNIEAIRRFDNKLIFLIDSYSAYGCRKVAIVFSGKWTGLIGLNITRRIEYYYKELTKL